MARDEGQLLGLDVGEARIGLALASGVARLARPAGTLNRSKTIVDDLKQLCRREGVTQLVIGLPRGLDGQETTQTTLVRAFASQLACQLGLPMAWQDEALTSKQAEAELAAKGKQYPKAAIDALAATYILEDYFHEHV